MDRGSANIRVGIRVRPMLSRETNRGDKLLFSCGDDGVSVEGPSSSTRRSRYVYDLVLPPSSTQEDVFSFCGIEELIKSSLDGYAATVFAYGVTGSGKTYTITGPASLEESSIATASSPVSGVLPRAIHDLFLQKSRRETEDKDRTFKICCTYVEIYNEQVNDLLNPSSQNLAVRWNAIEGFFVEGVLMIECASKDDITQVLIEGLKNRKVAENEVHFDSSRSHCLFTVYINQKYVDPTDGTTTDRFGKLHFVDLAGSERLGRGTMTESRERTKETQHINTSLLTLGRVISALGTGSHYVPYRESKLTKLLSDSLGGSSYTLMIACISSSSYHIEETSNTLKYAAQARNIENRPTVHMDAKEQLIEMLREEVLYLQQENMYLRRELEGKQLPGSGTATPPMITVTRDENGEKMSDKLSVERRSMSSMEISSKTEDRTVSFPGRRFANPLMASQVRRVIPNLVRTSGGFDVVRNKEELTSRLNEENSDLVFKNETQEKKIFELLEENERLRGLSGGHLPTQVEELNDLLSHLVEIGNSQPVLEDEEFERIRTENVELLRALQKMKRVLTISGVRVEHVFDDES